MINFSYFRNANLLESRANSEVTIHDILSHYSYIENICSEHSTLKVLIDCRGYSINVAPLDLHLVLPKLLPIAENMIYLKEAILVDKPQSTVIATIFQDKYHVVDNYIFKVFSTEDAARIWLGLE